MTHLSHDELVAWCDRPSDDARARVIQHLAECRGCAAALAALAVERRVAERPTALDPADFVARGVAARKPGRAAWRIRAAWVAPLAAAAGLAMAVMIFRQPAPDDSPVLRGGAMLTAVTPSGAVASVSEFRWEGPADTSFRLEILGPGGDLVHEARVRALRYVLPLEVQRSLSPGLEYQWTVTSLDVRGNAVDASAPATFSIR